MTSRRLESVKPSATMAMTARAIQLRREGRDIISLSVGEPDFPVFPHVEQAIVDALRKGQTKYTNASGTAELREAISDWMFAQVGVRYAPPQIVATSGAKQALYNACQALLDEGDEAVIPNPYWVSYPEMVKLAGARVVELMLRPEYAKPVNGLPNLPTRQGLYHAIDRQGITDVVTGGFGPIADSWISPADPMRKDVEASISKYPYDTTKALQLLAAEFGSNDAQRARRIYDLCFSANGVRGIDLREPARSRQADPRVPRDREDVSRPVLQVQTRHHHQVAAAARLQDPLVVVHVPVPPEDQQIDPRPARERDRRRQHPHRALSQVAPGALPVSGHRL